MERTTEKEPEAYQSGWRAIEICLVSEVAFSQMTYKIYTGGHGSHPISLKKKKLKM